MKLQKNNKYKGKIALGLATVMLSGILMSGCDSMNAVIDEKSYIVEETTMPELTPIPELSYDEEIALLGITDLNEIRQSGALFYTEYELDGKSRVMFNTISGVPNEKGGWDICDWFTKEKVFSLDYDLYEKEDTNYDISRMSILNPNLLGAKILGGGHITTALFDSQLIAESLCNSKYEKFLCPSTPEEFYELIDGSITNSKMADIYLDVVPKEYRVSANDLFVNQDKVLVK